MRTGAEYIESVSKLKPTLYHRGQKIDSMVDHPSLKWPIKVVAQIYDWCLDPQYQDILTTVSPIINDRVDRFLHVFGSVDDLLARQKQMRFLQTHLGGCAVKCTQLGIVNALYSTTYDMDEELGTNYHQRFVDYLRYMQQNDLLVTGAMMDAKGDRSLTASQQPDPDMYLHIVEERKDGVVVRGAKAHQTGPMFANEIAVAPCDMMRSEKERDYAVAFAIPSETKGITYILQQNLADAMCTACVGAEADLGNPTYGCQFGATSLMIFDDVFVPNERIFMKGEWKFTRHLVTRMGTMARLWQTGCRPAIFDLVIGATCLIAEYNGIARSAHVVDKLTEMSYLTETVWGLALGAAISGKPTPSGAYIPDPLLTNCAKLQSTRAFYEIIKNAIDITGGIIVSLPSEEDFRHPEAGKWMEKYLKGAAEFPTEHRLRVVRFLQAMTGGPLAAALHHSGGPMQNQKIIIFRETDFEAKKKWVRVLTGIEKEE